MQVFVFVSFFTFIERNSHIQNKSRKHTRIVTIYIIKIVKQVIITLQGENKSFSGKIIRNIDLLTQAGTSE